MCIQPHHSEHGGMALPDGADGPGLLAEAAMQVAAEAGERAAVRSVGAPP